MISAVLLNANRLDFDGCLSFDPVADVVDLVVHAETETADQVVERAQGKQILISKEQPLGREVLGRLDSVKLICEAGTGTDNIDAQAADELGIAVRNVAGYSTNDVAQLAMTFIGVLAAGLHRTLRRAGKGDLASSRPWQQPTSTDLTGKVLGVIGAGAIGTRLIRLARAYDMEVLVFNPSPRDWSSDQHITSCSLQDLLRQADYVSLHCPLTEDTRGMIGSAQLDRMRPGACLINVSRGGLVDHDALREALVEGHLAGVALDVQDPEPPAPKDLLWSLENVILTHHQGWKTFEARTRLVARVAEQIRGFLHSPDSSST